MFDRQRQRSKVTATLDRRDSGRKQQLSRVVALGLGEAGLSALRNFFIALEDSADMAFVIVQHGAPSAPNRVPQLLRELTDMPVVELKTRSTLAANHVYVAPPGVAIVLEAGQLLGRQLTEPNERRTVLDQLFRSLATTIGTRSVGVVLPGTGQDGALGAQAIARAGGTTFNAAQGGEIPASDRERVLGQALLPFEIAKALLEQSGHVLPAREHTAQVLQQSITLEREHVALQRETEQLQNEKQALEQQLNQVRAQLKRALTRSTLLLDAEARAAHALSAGPVGVVLLDAYGQVQGFGGVASHIYRISTEDLGKPLTAIAHTAHEMPALPNMADLRAGLMHEADVVTAERWYLRRVLATHHGRHVVSSAFGQRPSWGGMVLLFLDVTELKSLEAALRPEEQWIRSLTDGAPELTQHVDEAVTRLQRKV
jgi:PAS domain-containing protein